MDSEQWVYSSSLDHLASIPLDDRVSEALELLKNWSQHVNRSPIAKAACYYLIHFAIPTANGEDCSNKPLPHWVDDHLFHPMPKKIENIEAWLRLFPHSITEALNEREKGLGIPIEGDLSRLIERGKEKNTGLYFTPNGVTGTEVSKDGSRRLDANVSILNAFFLDFNDEDKNGQMQRLLAYPVSPSYIVESKRGYQPYWLLHEGMSQDEWCSGMKRLIQFFGSNESVGRPSSLMRLPFTWHTKTDDKFLVKVEAWSTTRYPANIILTPLPHETDVQKILKGSVSESTLISSPLL